MLVFLPVANPNPNPGPNPGPHLEVVLHGGVLARGDVLRLGQDVPPLRHLAREQALLCGREHLAWVTVRLRVRLRLGLGLRLRLGLGLRRRVRARLRLRLELRVRMGASCRRTSSRPRATY